MADIIKLREWAQYSVVHNGCAWTAASERIPGYYRVEMRRAARVTKGRPQTYTVTDNWCSCGQRECVHQRIAWMHANDVAVWQDGKVDCRETR